VAVADFIVQFKTLFPEFVPILNESGADVTDATITTYLDIAMDMLPQAIITYLSQTSVNNLVLYTTAHILSYYNVKDGYAEARTMIRNATSMSADGLSVGYESIAKLKGDMFPSLNSFLNTTAYGRGAALWLEKMSGSVGGFIV
jgi:hypothetical protein